MAEFNSFGECLIACLREHEPATREEFLADVLEFDPLAFIHEVCDVSHAPACVISICHADGSRVQLDCFGYHLLSGAVQSHSAARHQ